MGQSDHLHKSAIMSGLEKALFNLKFTAKQLNRQAAKASKDEKTEKDKLKKAIQQGHNDIAKIYAQNAIRKQEDVDRLMNQVADEAGVELHQEMEGAKAVAAAPVKSGPTEVEEDGLGERLGALRS